MLDKKLEHAYPNRGALLTERKRLRDILTGSGWVTSAQLETALASRPAGRRLGEHLVLLGSITEQDLYAALSSQNNLPLGKPRPETVSVLVTRSIPAVVAPTFARVAVPHRGCRNSYVAGSELPGEQMA